VLLPLGFLTFNDEAEQYLFAAILRSGVSKEVEGTLGLLRRVVPRLRDLFPRARIRVRLDGGFQGPQLFDLLDDLGVEYLVGFAKNSVLGRASATLLKKAVRKAKATGGDDEPLRRDQVQRWELEEDDQKSCLQSGVSDLALP
jgi:hypothetical protein